jgi:PEGA domain
MKRLGRNLPLFLLCAGLAWAAGAPWQYGRIVDVRKSVNTRTKAWVVNTPINEDETVYTISVHVLDKILVGNYEVGSDQSDPPPDWIANYPVKIQVVGDLMYLRSLTGDVRLHITQRKSAPRPMPPLTADEKKRLEQLEAAPESLVGFSEGDSKRSSRGSTTQAAPAEAAPQPPPPPTTGTVTVRSTPFLSEVFVDGDPMGYTPAKINLPPGKHAFRVEKPGYRPWTKEMMITVGSELILDASLDKK